VPAMVLFGRLTHSPGLASPFSTRPSPLTLHRTAAFTGCCSDILGDPSSFGKRVVCCPCFSLLSLASLPNVTVCLFGGRTLGEHLGLDHLRSYCMQQPLGVSTRRATSAAYVGAAVRCRTVAVRVLSFSVRCVSSD
jgi:hypothetical protein